MPDPKLSVAELAAEVVSLPDGADLENDTGLRVLLLGDKTVSRDPLKYAEIFERAACLAKSDWMRLACRAEVVNGRRRDPDWLLSELSAELANVGQELSKLSFDEQQKGSLLGKLYYNLGLLLRGERRYADAAKAQHQASAYYALAGNRESSFVSLFLVAVENASHELANDPRSKNSKGAVEALECAEKLVRMLLPVYPKWMVENAALHVVWARMMNNCVGFAAGVDLMHKVPEQLQDMAFTTNSPHWRALLETARLYRMVRDRAVVEKATRDLSDWGGLKSSSAKNVALSCQLLMALAKSRLNEDPTADLKVVAAYAGPDGGVPVAVAKQLLGRIKRR